MDSFMFAVRYVFIFLPMELICKCMEKVGVVYGIFDYSFHKGKARSRKTYDYLDKE